MLLYLHIYVWREVFEQMRGWESDGKRGLTGKAFYVSTSVAFMSDRQPKPSHDGH